MGLLDQFETKAEQDRLLRWLLDHAAFRSLVNPLDGAFPSTGQHRVVADLARVIDVNPSQGTVRLACLHLNSSPSDVQWISPMLDPKNGNGMYFVPKPGMFGLYFNIGGSDFFWGMFGVTEVLGNNLFLNFREPLPEGGVAVRTSAETKTVWGPNLTLMQAANFCKISLQRAAKRLSMLFYQLDMTSLGGSIKWVTDIAARFSTFYLTIRNKLPAGKDFAGRDKKSDPQSRELKVKAGAESTADANLVRVTMAKVAARGEVNSLESAAVARLRKIIREALGSTSNSAQVKADPFFNAAFGNFVLGSDTTQDLLVDSIVGAATYVHQAKADGINGVIDLAPPVDSVENLNATDLRSSITPLGSRAPTSLFSDTEVFVEANRLEVRKDPVTGQSVATPAAGYVAAARAGFTREDGIDSQDLMLELAVGTDGRIRLKQKTDAAKDSQYRFALEALSSLGILTEQGPLDVNAGKAFRLQFAEGGLILGNKAAGIIFTKDGDVEVRGRRVRLVSMDERPPYETDEFRFEEDSLEDFFEDEDATWYQPTIQKIRDTLLPLYYTIVRDRKGNIIRQVQKRTPFGTPPPITAQPRPNREGEYPEVKTDQFGRVIGVWKPYYDLAKKWGRDYNWDFRRRFLAEEKKRAPERTKALEALEASFKTRSAKKARLSDSGTTMQVTSRGISMGSNSSVRLRSGVSVRTESSYPVTESATTLQTARDSALTLSGIPDFKAIDKAEADAKAKAGKR